MINTNLPEKVLSQSSGECSKAWLHVDVDQPTGEGFIATLLQTNLLESDEVDKPTVEGFYRKASC